MSVLDTLLVRSASEADALIVAEVRKLSGVAAGTGPDDAHIASAVRGFADRFEFWYMRVMRQAVIQYRDLIIKRINPIVRRMECDGLAPRETAGKLVDDYSARNFVTAGGWALERLAIEVGQGKKSEDLGIDVEKVYPITGDHHLYFMKSGLVTRNSDILSALKRNASKARRRLQETGRKVRVIAHYAILTGKTRASFEDGINRPSSAQVWMHMTGLPERQALDLVLAIAAVAGRLVRRDVNVHVEAMKTLVADYIAERGDGGAVDWTFLARRNMEAEEGWAADDEARHERALGVLKESGYVPESQ